MPRKVKDLTGFRSGTLTAISFEIKKNAIGQKLAVWLCKCDCGNQIYVRGNALTSGHRKFCPKCNPRLNRDFWGRVTKAGDDECWNWNGYIGSQGYGAYSVNHVQRGSHRVAWELTKGPIPDGLFVCHKCDNPKCCNPSHLFLGTHDDNMADRSKKCRAKNRFNGHCRTKLSGDRLDLFKSRIASGERPFSIAKDFGIHGSTACKISRQLFKEDKDK